MKGLIHYWTTVEDCAYMCMYNLYDIIHVMHNNQQKHTSPLEPMKTVSLGSKNKFHIWVKARSLPWPPRGKCVGFENFQHHCLPYLYSHIHSYAQFHQYDQNLQWLELWRAPGVPAPHKQAGTPKIQAEIFFKDFLKCLFLNWGFSRLIILASLLILLFS